MNNFKVIYKILRYLEKSMDFPEPDMTPISAQALELSEDRWKAIICMLQENGYVSGVSIKNYYVEGKIINIQGMRITLQGLEYLEENSIMKKLHQTAKGLVDLIP